MRRAASLSNDPWPHPSYEVKVRGSMYVWGSSLVTHNITFDSPPLLHMRNDIFGENVTFGTQVAGGAKTTLGTLGPGECISLPLQGISGVFATCALESTVCCFIKS